MNRVYVNIKNLFVKKIHTLTLVSYQGTMTYPKKLEYDEIAHFSTVRKAGKYIKSLTYKDYPKSDFKKQQNIPDKEQQHFVVYALEESYLNKPYEKGVTRYYEINGELTGKNTMRAEPLIPFHGQDAKSCRYNKGQIVSFMYGDTIQAGIILAQPVSKQRAKSINTWNPERNIGKKDFESYKRSRGGSLLDQTDDTYMILFDKDDHAHEQECNIIPMKGKVTEKQKAMLRRRYTAYTRNQKP